MRSGSLAPSPAKYWARSSRSRPACTRTTASVDGSKPACLAEHVHGDGKALEPVGFAGLFPFDKVAQQLSCSIGSRKRFAGQNSLQRLAHCGGVRRGVLQVSSLSRVRHQNEPDHIATDLPDKRLTTRVARTHT